MRSESSPLPGRREADAQCAAPERRCRSTSPSPTSRPPARTGPFMFHHQIGGVRKWRPAPRHHHRPPAAPHARADAAAAAAGWVRAHASPPSGTNRRAPAGGLDARQPQFPRPAVGARRALNCNLPCAPHAVAATSPTTSRSTLIAQHPPQERAGRAGALHIPRDAAPLAGPQIYRLSGPAAQAGDLLVCQRHAGNSGAGARSEADRRAGGNPARARCSTEIASSRMCMRASRCGPRRRSALPGGGRSRASSRRHDDLFELGVERRAARVLVSTMARCRCRPYIERDAEIDDATRYQTICTRELAPWRRRRRACISMTRCRLVASGQGRGLQTDCRDIARRRGHVSKRSRR